MNEQTDERQALAGQVEREVRPVAWWRKSSLPECRPCVTTDEDEAQQWRDDGHIVVFLGDVAAERERHCVDDGHGDRIDALLLKAKEVVARSERPQGCADDYRVPAAEWLSLQAEVMHRLREHAREALIPGPNAAGKAPAS